MHLFTDLNIQLFSWDCCCKLIVGESLLQVQNSKMMDLLHFSELKYSGKVVHLKRVRNVRAVTLKFVCFFFVCLNQSEMLLEP